jgi:Helicase conserved C-terminal domain
VEHHLNPIGVPAADARAAIASHWLGARQNAVLGSVVLRPHQQTAAHRLRALLAASRGALLADPVGLGKTYTALAVARSAAKLVVVAPAALRDMWRDACAAAGIRARLVSYHALSRGRVPPDADFVIADESHHARNPSTRRYRALATLCARPPVLLLSATPIHNRPEELRAQLALFLGAHAWAMSEADLARFVVKREADAVVAGDQPPPLPRARAVAWMDVGDDASLLEGIERLPPPLPFRDAGDAGALVALSLVRQWASSRAALIAALRRRLALASALSDALRAGRHPSRAELRAWSYADGVLQLAFPEFATAAALRRSDLLLDQTERHAEHLAALLRTAAAGSDPDDARAAAIAGVRARHPDHRVVVFAEFAETVRALYARLGRGGGAAMVTERGGVVAGGRLTRQALLAQFAPGATDRIPASERVSLLLTTDLLSEGVNLQGAAVVVHADLPWSPARFEQRVGRVRRLQSRHAEVFIYALRPPAPAARLLQLETRFRAKLAAAARTVGIRGTIMPRLFPHDAPAPRPAVQTDSEIAMHLARWPRAASKPAAGAPLAAAVRGPRPGFLALIETDGRADLVADLGRGVTDRRDTLVEALRLADGTDAPLAPSDAEAVLAAIGSWRASRDCLDVIDLAAGSAARARRRLLHRIDAIAARSPRHLRSRYVPLARDARRVASATIGAGAELVLEELAEARMPDEAWLRAVGMFAELHARRPANRGQVRAVVVFISDKH